MDFKFVLPTIVINIKGETQLESWMKIGFEGRNILMEQVMEDEGPCNARSLSVR